MPQSGTLNNTIVLYLFLRASITVAHWLNALSFEIKTIAQEAGLVSFEHYMPT